MESRPTLNHFLEPSGISYELQGGWRQVSESSLNIGQIFPYTVNILTLSMDIREPQELTERG